MNRNPLRFALPIAALSLVSLAVTLAPARACRVEPASFAMEVLVDGRPIAAYAASGTTYVEALKGHDYAIRLSNRTGERIGVALSVDGLNVIDAKHTTARDGRKWILDPWQSIVLTGWQTSTSTARRFVFTSEARSYGTWLGRTSDLGTISAAFFRERPRADAPVPPAQIAPPLGRLKDDRNAPREGAGGAPSAEPQKKAVSAPSDELAATGIGGEVEHRVTRVEFEEEDAPASVVTVRYEFHDALVKLGVIRDTEEDAALARRGRAHGFEDTGFAPDPYRGR
jgi:hypothetical protein